MSFLLHVIGLTPLTCHISHSTSAHMAMTVAVICCKYGGVSSGIANSHRMSFQLTLESHNSFITYLNRSLSAPIVLSFSSLQVLHLAWSLYFCLILLYKFCVWLRDSSISGVCESMQQVSLVRAQ